MLLFWEVGRTLQKQGIDILNSRVISCDLNEFNPYLEIKFLKDCRRNTTHYSMDSRE
jgi:hypothetical protein